jgi:hypothetical protein
MDLQEIEWGGMDYIHLVQDRISERLSTSEERYVSMELVLLSYVTCQILKNLFDCGPHFSASFSRFQQQKALDYRHIRPILSNT